VLENAIFSIMEQPTDEPVAQAQTEGQIPTPAPTNPDTTDSVPAPATSTPAAPSKPVHSLVIDANAIIKNDPTVSTLLAQAEELYTIPAVVEESAFATLPACVNPR
jgi:RNA-binding protein NOB1